MTKSKQEIADRIGVIATRSRSLQKHVSGLGRVADHIDRKAVRPIVMESSDFLAEQTRELVKDVVELQKAFKEYGVADKEFYQKEHTLHWLWVFLVGVVMVSVGLAILSL